ncbi:MAG: hypothetical protein IPP25_14035 [Saprospiraceae bacterium]|nr:hypothetical protein [Candidatus Opimibacter skivensis]
MTKNLPFLCFALFTLTGCEMLQVITAKNHKPEIQTPESIRHYAKKHGFDGYPILTLDTSIYSSDIVIQFGIAMYNREGQFLSLVDDLPGCPDKHQEYTATRFILEKGDAHFIKDSLSMRQGSLKEPNTESYSENKKKGNEFFKDTTLWEFQTITYSAHLDSYVPFIRTLEGNEVDIYSYYKEYLIIYEYQMSGYAKFDRILIREKIKQLEKLEKEFGPRIQLVLVNRDQLETNALSVSKK